MTLPQADCLYIYVNFAIWNTARFSQKTTDWSDLFSAAHRGGNPHYSTCRVPKDSCLAAGPSHIVCKLDTRV